MSLWFRSGTTAGEGGVSAEASGGLLVGALRREHYGGGSTMGGGSTALLGALSRVPLRPGLLQRAAGQAGILAFCRSSPPSPKLSLCGNPRFCQLRRWKPSRVFTRLYRAASPSTLSAVGTSGRSLGSAWRVASKPAPVLPQALAKRVPLDRPPCRRQNLNDF